MQLALCLWMLCVCVFFFSSSRLIVSNVYNNITYSSVCHAADTFMGPCHPLRNKRDIRARGSAPRINENPNCVRHFLGHSPNRRIARKNFIRRRYLPYAPTIPSMIDISIYRAIGTRAAAMRCSISARSCDDYRQIIQPDMCVSSAVFSPGKQRYYLCRWGRRRWRSDISSSSARWLIVWGWAALVDNVLINGCSKMNRNEL